MANFEGILLCSKCHAPIPRLSKGCFTCAPAKERLDPVFRYFVPPEHKPRAFWNEDDDPCT